MDPSTCPTCGCLVGDEEAHRAWHETSTGDGPGTERPAPDPGPGGRPDPAPYSA